MAFGATQDYFSLADTKWALQTSADDASGSNAQVQDSFGTTECESIYDEFSTYANSYRIKSATSDTSGVIALSVDTKAVIGQVFAIDTNTNASVTGIEVSTSNTENPMVTITAEEFFGDTTAQATFPATLTVLGIKKAQAFGFVVVSGTRTTSGSVSLSGQSYRVLDSQGDPCQTDVYQGRAEGSGDLAACTGTPSATADTANSWAFSNQPSTAEENTGYGTAAVAVFRNLARV